MNKERCSPKIINEPRSSLLRKEFESFDGQLKLRDISLNKVTDEIADLENRPEYTPNIHILQIRELDEYWSYVFSEKIYTNNAFLDNFERFIRENMVGIPAEDFDNVPKGYLHFFKTPYSLITCDIDRTEVSVTYPNGDYKSIAHDKFRGVDFNSPCTLRMLEPKTLYDKLEDIEKGSVFAITIEKSHVKNREFIGFEYRRGNKQVTVDHFVFRK